MSTEATPVIDTQEEVPGYKAPEKKDLKDIVSCYFVPCHFKQILFLFRFTKVSTVDH